DNGDIRPFVTVGPGLASSTGVPSPTDVFYTSWTNGKDVFSSFSPDGITWSPASKINDTQPGASINAMISVGADGKIYAGWADYQGPGANSGKSFIWTASSTDQGVTWSPTRKVRTIDINNFDFVNFLQDPFTTNATGGLSTVYALNVQVPSSGLLSDARGISVLPRIAVDRSSPAGSPYSHGPGSIPGNPHGRIYVSYTDAPSPNGVGNPVNHDNTNIFVTHSDAGGVTWSAPVRVNDDGSGSTASQFFASVDVDPDTGIVGLSWYDDRDGTTNDVTRP